VPCCDYSSASPPIQVHSLDLARLQILCSSMNATNPQKLTNSKCVYACPQLSLTVWHLPFLGFSKDKDHRKKPVEPMLNSLVSCIRCANGNTAKLLLITGQWNFYYCSQCRRWSQSHYSARGALIPIENDRIENSLTWYWRTETELMQENQRALEWIRSIFLGKDYDERSKLV